MSPTQNKDENQRRRWSKELLYLLCDLCTQYVIKSKGKNGGITSQRLMWKKIEAEFNKKSNLAWDKGRLKNKVDWMRSRWSLWKQLKGKETGLGWDRVKGTISANDEWWTLKIKENPKFESFQEEGIEPELEHRMDQIFGTYSPQQHEIHEIYVPSPSHTNDEHVSLDDTNVNIGDDNCYGGALCDDVWRESSPTPTSTHIPQVTQIDRDNIRRGKRAFEGDSLQSNKSARTTSTIRGGVATMQEMLGDLMQQIKEMNTSPLEMNASMMNMMSMNMMRMNMDMMNSMSSSTTKYDVADALAKVISLHGSKPRTPEFFFACTMIEDPQKRTIFFGLPDDESRAEYIKYLYDRENHTKT